LIPLNLRDKQINWGWLSSLRFNMQVQGLVEGFVEVADYFILKTFKIQIIGK
jgi:hypothetical protein